MSGAPTSEGQLIRRARDGDEDAFADLVGIHADRVYGALRRFGLDASEAEDVAQDVFLRAWRGLPPTGRHLEFPLCAIFTFDANDRMLGERIYYDRATVLRQLGVLSEPTTLGGRLGMLLLHPATVVGAGMRSAFRRVTSRS